MPKGKGQRKKSNIPDFIQYAQENKNRLTTKQIYESYKDNSKYGIKKQTALDIMRTIFGYEKGEKKGQTVSQKVHEDKAKKYIPKVKKRKPKAKIKVTSTKGHYITLDIKNDVSHIEKGSPTIELWRKKLKNMFGYDGDQYIQVNITVLDDGYTKHNKFLLWSPFNGRKKQGVKTLGEKIVNNLTIFYSNLLKRYSTGSRSNMSKNILSSLTEIKKEIQHSKGLDKNSLEQIFEDKGIRIDKYEIIYFTHNGGK